MVKQANSKKARVSEDGASSPGSGEEAPCTPEVCELFAADFEHCELRSFVGNSGAENKNAKLIMMNTSAIPCCAEKCREDEKKSTPVKLTLIHVQAPGFSAAPYAVPFGGGKGKVGDNPKPLTALETVDKSVKANGLRMWPFKKESMPGNRGPRYDDRSFLLESGDTFILFVSKMDFTKHSQYGGDNPNSLFPKDVQEIPPFSLLEVHVMSKPGDPTMNRENELMPRMSCVRFCMVRLGANSLYSYVDSLAAFPRTLEDSRRAALAKKETFEVISKDIEAQDIAFYIPSVERAATVCEHALESDSLLSVAGWSLEPMDAAVTLDIPVDVLLKYTNASSLQWATTFLELAINMGCVSFLAFNSDYFRRSATLSNLRVVPLVDTRRLFSCVQLRAPGLTGIPEGDATVFRFETGCLHRGEDGRDLPITLSIALEQRHVALEGTDLPTRDLILCSKGFHVPKAHSFVFGLGSGCEHAAVLRGYLRVDASASAGTSSLKRVRFGCDDV
mmetsp:Transcript_30041/g.71254  ORF Transcript_30041/g.71254 Transcript_30041/m.71254 type:complete len:504 (+) Transcript_30041:888-2399(+)